MIRCETCGAECQSNKPFRLLRSTNYVQSWYNIHNNPPHKIDNPRKDCLRWLII